MLKRAGSKSGYRDGSQGSHTQALQAIDALYEREIQANMAALSEQRRRSRLQRSAVNLTEYWPFAVGIVLSCFVPQLRDFVEQFRPYGMWVVFPFAAIATRPEISSGSEISSLMPLMFMYAQFPLEGLLARFGLKGHVTVPRVLGQVLFLHLFAITELWLVSGPWGAK
jgi:hypothetical protein